MGFTKEAYEPTLTIEVAYPLYPGTVFSFTFNKEFSELARTAQTDYFALPDTERAEVKRAKFIAALAELLTTEPAGFDDLPRDGSPLAARVLAYFDDSARPDLERILKAAWNKYWEAIAPVAFQKRLQDSEPRASQLSAVPS